MRSRSGRPGPLGGLDLEHLIAAGRSQSASRLVTYLNAFHLRDAAFDGYFVHSRGGSAAGVRADALASDPEVPRWVVDVPSDLSMGPGCVRAVNAAPHHAYVKSGLRALTTWVRSDEAPPQSPEIRVSDPGAADPILRDMYGNTVPFDDQTLQELYPTHQAFVDAFVATVDALERQGCLLAPEADEHRRAARASDIRR